MIDNKMTFVLPFTLKETGGGDWRHVSNTMALLRVRLLLKSFLKNFRSNDLHKFLIVSPKSELDQIKNLITQITPDHRFEVLDETQVCTAVSSVIDPRTGNIDGWYAQQLLKLSAASIVETEFYTTMDSDIICPKPFALSSLVEKGRSWTNIETADDYRRLYVPKFAVFEEQIKTARMKAAEQLLRCEQAGPGRETFYGETPVVLNTENVRNLCRHLSGAWKEEWSTRLARVKGWTEYALYFRFLEWTGTISDHHRLAGCNRVLDLERSIWHETNKYRANRFYAPTHFLHEDSDGGVFLCIQSWLNPKNWLRSTHSPSVLHFYEELDRLLI